MTDGRVPELTVAEAAAMVGGRVVGDGAVAVRGVAPVDQAGPHDLGLLAARRYVRYLPTSGARALLVSEELVERAGDARTLLVVREAHEALPHLLAYFHPEPETSAEIHPTAVIGRGVRLGRDVALGPYAVLEDGARVGDRSRVGAHAVVGRGSTVGVECTLHPHVVLYARTVLGDRVTVHSGARVGVDGFGYVFVDGEHRKVPQVGRCIVGEDVEIGANTTLDRGSIGDTVVGAGSKMDNLVHLAHNVRLGARSLLAALVGIAGSARVGEGVMFGGQAGVADHVELGDGVRVAAATKVLRDVPAGQVVSGNPARPNRQYLRVRALTERLPEIYARLKTLEKAGEGGNSLSGGS